MCWWSHESCALSLTQAGLGIIEFRWWRKGSGASVRMSNLVKNTVHTSAVSCLLFLSLARLRRVAEVDKAKKESLLMNRDGKDL